MLLGGGYAAVALDLGGQIDLDTLSAQVLGVAEQTMEPTMLSLWPRPPVEHFSRFTP